MRKHFLIKPKIQLLHLALTLGALTLSILIGYIFVESTLATSNLPSLVSSGEWHALRHNLRWGFFIVFIVLLIAVGIEHLLFFHSIVGPLYALENALKRMIKGELNDPVHIRESDQLKDLVDSFEVLRKKLQAESGKKSG